MNKNSIFILNLARYGAVKKFFTTLYLATGQPHEKTEEICYNLPKGDGQL